MDSSPESRDTDVLRRALVPLFGDLDVAAVREIAASGTWIDVEGGRRLIRRGDPAEALYLVVRGRLVASVPDPDGRPRILGEIARGEAVGEMALLGGGVRNADIDAVRDSRLLRIESGAFRALATRHPEFLWNLSRLVLRRTAHAPGSGRGVPRVRTIAIVGAGAVATRSGFARRLAAALAAHGPVESIDRAAVAAAPGAATDPRGLAEWLDDLETRNRFVLASADAADPAWSEFLLRHADRVLVVSPADGNPADPEIARWTAADRDRPVHVRRDLVLLHPDGSRMPSGTGRWLDLHGFARAHHVRGDHERDVERIARFLAGRAVAVVLAGGGAKGFAHLGVLRALEEDGLPVDLVAGTSIGAILAATVAFDWNEADRRANVRRAFVETNPANDYEIPPVASLLGGRKMERLLRSFLGDVGIEDLWLPFFCVSSDLTTSEKAVHVRGPVWKALRASASIAGVFPPVVLDGHLHVDGGTFDNLPVEVARGLDAGHVVACDIDRSNHAKVRFDAVPPGRTLLLDRLLRRRRYRVPGMITTMMQTTFLAGLERARMSALDADLYFEPKARGVRFLEWGAVDRAAELGYAQAREALADPSVRSRLEAIVRPVRGD